MNDGSAEFESWMIHSGTPLRGALFFVTFFWASKRKFTITSSEQLSYRGATALTQIAASLLWKSTA